MTHLYPHLKMKTNTLVKLSEHVARAQRLREEQKPSTSTRDSMFYSKKKHTSKECFHCGRKDHIVANRTLKNLLKCNNCKKIGHIESTCR